MTIAVTPERPSQTRSVISYFSGTLTATTLTVFATLLITRWTPPYQMGLWNFALLISTYASILQVGVFNGLNRQLPYFQGKGDLLASDRASGAAHGWCIALTGASVTATAGVAAFVAIFGSNDLLFTVIAIGTVVSCSWFLQLFTVGYSVTSQFSMLARKNTAVALVGLPLASLAYFFGYTGLLIRAAAQAVLTVLLLGHRRPLPSTPRWDVRALWKLARIGFPIWLVGQLGALFMTLDRAVLANSPQDLGYYIVAAQFGALAALVPNAFNAVHYPQMARNYGATHLARPLWSHALRATGLSMACGLALSLPCWWLIPVFVQHVLPDYSPGIEAAKWASLTGVALAPSMFGNLFNLLGRQDIYLISAAVGLATFIGAWFVLTRMLHQPHLVSAAQCMLLGTFVASITSATLTLLVCSRHDAKSEHLTAAEGAARS